MPAYLDALPGDLDAGLVTADIADHGTVAGLPLIVAPGVVSTLRMPWEGDADGPIDYDLPPPLAFHDGDRLTTHFRVVP